ncbi:MAG: UvrD-helicase domain-containing protein [Lentisphaeria bacterium]|nr:UvrD-helicase domain-containing protein [Lentisphaeria bacterium]
MDSLNYPTKPGRYLLEASAGTGKTWTITQLFLQLVLQGIPVSRILVTTFSKTAAAELKERIVALLDKELRNRDLDEAAPMREKLLLRLAISSIDEATIGTIHSFCQKMLRDYPLDSRADFNEVLIANEDKYRDRLVRAFCRGKFYRPEASTESIPIDNFKKTTRLEADPEEIIPSERAGREHYHEVFEYVRKQLGAEKKKDRVISFNDLIRRFHRAVMSSDTLAKQVGERYQAVFVDEFQDTDRFQFEIFDRCFPRGGNTKTLFYMIGDPKQAIYEFRGADIHAYLAAKETAEQKFDMTKNHRSTPTMIEAVNRIFGDGNLSEGHQTKETFLQEDIPFITVASGHEHPEKRFPSMQKHPLRLRHYIEPGKEAEKHIYEDVVREIVWLLSGQTEVMTDEEKIGENGEKVYIPRPLKPSDIAILVPKHEQAEQFLLKLNRAGIPAAACKSGKIYSSPEARVMLLLLQTLLDPEERNIRGLLISPFFRLTSRQLLQQDYDLEKISGGLAEMAAEWRKNGLPSAFLHFLDSRLAGSDSPRLCLLKNPDGERAVTNYLQLMELLYEKEAREHLLPEDVLNYLNLAVNQQIKDDQAVGTGLDDNPDQLRLDRDSDTVQLLTMFAAKGMEFPVVFIPFPVRTAGGELTKYDIAYKVRTAEGKDLLDFSRSEENKELAFYKALQSQVRLLYVALTRATYVTYLYTRERVGRERINYVKSAQGVIMTKADAIGGAESTNYYTARENRPKPAAEWVEHLVVKEESEWKVFARTPERENSTRVKIGTETGEFAARKAPFVPDKWRVMSFSTFKDLWDNTAEEEEKTEEPADRDQDPRTPEEKLPQPVPGTASFLDFPRGSRVGDMVHGLLEQLSGKFSAFDPDCPPERVAEIRAMAAQALRSNDYDPDKLGEALFDGLVRALRTPLPGIGIPLCRIRNYMQETEFFLDAGNSLDLHKILAVMREKASEPVRSRIGADNASFGKKGMVNGLTDLIFEHEGKYYIVDWKTNWLGRHESDYAEGPLLDAMIENRYVLQAYLYSAALLRLLRRNNLSDDRFGGVFYLFLRGMSPGGQNGIWHDVPPVECLDSMLKLFQQGE